MAAGAVAVAVGAVTVAVGAVTAAVGAVAAAAATVTAVGAAVAAGAATLVGAMVVGVPLASAIGPGGLAGGGDAAAHYKGEHRLASPVDRRG